MSQGDSSIVNPNEDPLNDSNYREGKQKFPDYPKFNEQVKYSQEKENEEKAKEEAEKLKQSNPDKSNEMQEQNGEEEEKESLDSIIISENSEEKQDPNVVDNQNNPSNQKAENKKEIKELNAKLSKQQNILCIFLVLAVLIVACLLALLFEKFYIKFNEAQLNKIYSKNIGKIFNNSANKTEEIYANFLKNILYDEDAQQKIREKIKDIKEESDKIINKPITNFNILIIDKLNEKEHSNYDSDIFTQLQQLRCTKEISHKYDYFPLLTITLNNCNFLNFYLSQITPKLEKNETNPNWPKKETILPTEVKDFIHNLERSNDPNQYIHCIWYYLPDNFSSSFENNLNDILNRVEKDRKIKEVTIKKDSTLEELLVKSIGDLGENYRSCYEKILNPINYEDCINKVMDEFSDSQEKKYTENIIPKPIGLPYHQPYSSLNTLYLEKIGNAVFGMVKDFMFDFFDISTNSEKTKEALHYLRINIQDEISKELYNIEKVIDDISLANCPKHFDTCKSYFTNKFKKDEKILNKAIIKSLKEHDELFRKAFLEKIYKDIKVVPVREEKRVIGRKIRDYINSEDNEKIDLLYDSFKEKVNKCFKEEFEYEI